MKELSLNLTFSSIC